MNKDEKINLRLASQLSEAVLKDLEKAYRTYFREDCTIQGGILPRKLEEIIQKRIAEKYTRQMLDRIKNKGRICIVNVLDTRINGFITGRVLEDGVGLISNIFARDENLLERRMLILALYDGLAQEFKKRGVTKVVAEADTYDHRLIDILETLGLEELDREDKLIEYGTSIGSVDDGPQKHI